MARQRLRAAVFSRESRGKGSSIDDQDRENRAACDDLDAEVVVTLRDTVGASHFTAKRRVGWPKITELVRGGQIDLLVVWEVSRADRTMDTWVPFISACAVRAVRLHITSLEMTYDPRKAAHRKALLDMGSSAEHETGQLSERSRKGVRGAVLAGKAHGPSTYGYTREYGPIVDGKRTFTEVPDDNAPIVIEVITRIAKREPLITIEHDLEARGVPGPLANGWHRSTLKRMAHNQAYLGKRTHNGEVYEGNWPPISDAPDWEETFQRANDVLNEPARKSSRPGQTRHLLSYIAIAGGCGHDGRLNMQNRGKKSARYQCVEDGCVSILAAEMEEHVLRLVVNRVSQPDVRRLLDSGGGELAAVAAEVARLERQLEEAQESFADPNGGISAKALALKERRIEPLLEDARRREREARRVNDVLDVFGDDDELDEKIARQRWGAATLQARRAILVALFDGIEVWPAPFVLARRTLNMHATFDERMALVADRVMVRWAGQDGDRGGDLHNEGEAVEAVEPPASAG